MSWDPTRIVDVKAAIGAIGDVVQLLPDGPDGTAVAVDLGPGLLLDIAPSLMREDLAAHIVTPARPVHDFGNCIRLRFVDDAEARATSLGATWTDEPKD